MDFWSEDISPWLVVLVVILVGAAWFFGSCLIVWFGLNGVLKWLGLREVPFMVVLYGCLAVGGLGSFWHGPSSVVKRREG